MIVDPDSEQLLIDYLAERLPPLGVDWPVGDRAPIGPTSYIVLIRTGGARRDLVTDQAQITIDTVSGDSGSAAHVANLVRALINDLWGGVALGGHPVYQVNELSGPYSNPTRTDLFRYSQSFLVAIRAAQVTSTQGVPK